jgi:hypothetical protein
MVHVEQADRARLHQDHRVMLDAFVATLPPGSGLVEADS